MEEKRILDDYIELEDLEIGGDNMSLDLGLDSSLINLDVRGYIKISRLTIKHY